MMVKPNKLGNKNIEINYNSIELKSIYVASIIKKRSRQ